MDQKNMALAYSMLEYADRDAHAAFSAACEAAVACQRIAKRALAGDQEACAALPRYKAEIARLVAMAQKRNDHFERVVEKVRRALYAAAAEAAGCPVN